MTGIVVVVGRSAVSTTADMRIVVLAVCDIVRRRLVVMVMVGVMIAVMIDDMILVVTEVVVRVSSDRSGARRLDLQHDFADIVLILVVVRETDFQVRQWVAGLEVLLNDSRIRHVFQVTQFVARSGWRTRDWVRIEGCTV